MPKDRHRLCQHRLFVSSGREGDGCRSRCRTRPARRRGAAGRAPAWPHGRREGGGDGRRPLFPLSPSSCPRSPARWQHFWAIRRRRPGEGGRWAGAGAAGRGSAGSPGAASGRLAAGRWVCGEEERVESSGNVGPRSRTRWLTLPSSTAWPLAARGCVCVWGGGVTFWSVTYTGMSPGICRAAAGRSFTAAVPVQASAAGGRGGGTGSAVLKLACSQTEFACLFRRWETGRESQSAARCRVVTCPELLQDLRRQVRLERYARFFRPTQHLWAYLRTLSELQLWSEEPEVCLSMITSPLVCSFFWNQKCADIFLKSDLSFFNLFLPKFARPNVFLPGWCTGLSWYWSNLWRWNWAKVFYTCLEEWGHCLLLEYSFMVGYKILYNLFDRVEK